MIVGVTGLIGSGKSTAANILCHWGAALIDADQIGREVVDQSKALRQKLAKQFGKDILTQTGRLRRARLAERAFATDDNVEVLNQIVHPYLLRALRKKVKCLSKLNGIVVIDAALLLNWNLDREIDCVLLIHAAKDIRMKRLLNRGITKKDTAAREARQLTYGDYRSRADKTILNNSSTTALISKLKAFWVALR